MSKVCTNDVIDSTLDYTVSRESDIVSDSVLRSLSSCDWGHPDVERETERNDDQPYHTHHT